MSEFKSPWIAIFDVIFAYILPWAIAGLLAFGSYQIWETNTKMTALQAKQDFLYAKEAQNSEVLKTVGNDLQQIKIDVAVLKSLKT